MLCDHGLVFCSVHCYAVAATTDAALGASAASGFEEPEGSLPLRHVGRVAGMLFGDDSRSFLLEHLAEAVDLHGRLRHRHFLRHGRGTCRRRTRPTGQVEGVFGTAWRQTGGKMIKQGRLVVSPPRDSKYDEVYFIVCKTACYDKKSTLWPRQYEMRRTGFFNNDESAQQCQKMEYSSFGT